MTTLQFRPDRILPNVVRFHEVDKNGNREADPLVGTLMVRRSKVDDLEKLKALEVTIKLGT